MREDIKVHHSLLKKECNLSPLKLENNEVSNSKEIIGQNRAMKALRFGLSIERKGYNIFVSGLTGTGRNSYSYSVANEFADNDKVPNDWCYVYNFKKPAKPKAIKIQYGKGKLLKEEVEKSIKKLKIEIPKFFTSKEYEEKRNKIYSKYTQETESLIDKLNEIGLKYGFKFNKTEKGLVTYPIVDGRPMKEEEVENLSEEEIEKLKEDSSKLYSETREIMKEIRVLETQLKDNIRELKEELALDIVSDRMDIINRKFKENNSVKEYLSDMKDDIVKNLSSFIEKEDTKKIESIISKGKEKEDIFKRYEVNVFIDNSNKRKAPVIKEMNPNYYNLLGKIEYFYQLGVLKTDHTRIKPGALHEANGGYLIVQAKDVLTSPFAWEGLKRTLISEQIKIENIAKGNVVAETIKPEPIPINLKIIMVGDHRTYQLLYNYDDDFKKLFRIRADFDIEMDRNHENIEKIFKFVKNHSIQEKLKDFDNSAIEKIIEYSSRMAENQNKLTSRFNDIVEILYESDALAKVNDDKVVTGNHVISAIEQRAYRNNKYEEKLQELFKEGTILIQTSGYEIGQINGLSVIDSGQYSFGRPNRITVSTYSGKDGILNIEREVEQSGNIHDKGVLILGGYLGEKYAKDKPLTLSASITFEQSYSFVDGDSASSTELYALLSSLADTPINQAIAVTGSVNQKGSIQPIGGVNEKIEGYYKVCKEKGFKGGEGVIIPHQNISNLMLDDEVINAVKEGKFTIYAVKTIDEGIEILTGIRAGELSEDGNYEKDTINYMVQEKLNHYAKLGKEYE